MGYSAGTFSVIYNFDTEAASPPIEIAKLTEQFTDIANGLSVVMLRDGTGLPTASQNLNAQTLTNIGASTTRTGVPQTAQIQDGTVTTLGSVAGTDTITGSLTPAITAYTNGMTLKFIPANTNTGAATLNVNSVAARSIVKASGVALVAGDIVAGVPAVVVYDLANTRWLLTTAVKVPDASLSSNVPLKNVSNTFSAESLILNGTAPLIDASRNTKAGGLVGFRARGGSGGIDWYIFQNTNSDTLTFYDGTADRFAIASGGNFDFKAGTVDGSNLSSQEVGYRGVPANAQAANYTTVLADAGKAIVHASGAGAGDTYTIAANASVAYPLNTVLTFINADSNSVSIAINSDTLTMSGTTSSGTRTLAQNGVATAIKVSSTVWLVSGVGLS